MIRSVSLARSIVVLLSLLASLLVVSGTADDASAATQYGAHTIYTTNELCKLTVTPKDANAVVGAQQTFTATISAIGPQMPTESFDLSYSDTFNACGYKQLGELEGMPVDFKVVSGPNAGKTASAALNSAGVANFTFSSAVAGTDVVEAELVLPDICFVPYNEPTAASTQALPAACAGMFGPQTNAMSVTQCDEPQVEDVSYEYDCPTVTLSDSGQVTWSAAAAVGAQSADPSLSVARFKRCVSGAFKIAPSYSGGVIKTSTLFVDGKKKQTRSGSEPFTLGARSFKAGKHNYEIVTSFTSGKAASKFGSFTRCAARVTVKRVTPKLAG